MFTQASLGFDLSLNNNTSFPAQWYEQVPSTAPTTSGLSEAAPPQPPTNIASNQTNEWMIQWFDETKKNVWNVGTPQFKYCKKRKEHFSEEFPDIWYKAPYKYHMQLEVEGMKESDNILALVELNYEDGQAVVYNKGTSGKKSKKNAQKQNSDQPQLSSGVVSNNENYFIHSQRLNKNDGSVKSEVTIGPFQFNICSYKQDGRKFRMVTYLYSPSATPLLTPHGVSLVCCLVSPSFTIRAKKPIVSPGIKKNKQSKEVEDESPSPKKRRSPAVLEEERDESLPDPKKQRTVAPLVQAAPVPPVPTSNAAIAQPPSTTTVPPAQPQDKVMDDFLYQLDIYTPGTPVAGKIGEKPQSSSEKIQQVITLFKSLDDKERKEILGQMLDNTYAHEKEFIRRKYFEHPSDNSLFTQQPHQPSHQQMHDYSQFQYYVQQQQQQQQTTQQAQYGSADVDHFFVDLL